MAITSFYGFVNKKLFSVFFTQNVKNALRPMGNLKSYNFGIVEDTYKLFAPNRGFSGSANFMVSFKLTPDHPLLPWQPIVVIKHKISYNIGLYRRYAPHFAHIKGFSGTANLTA